MRIENIKPIKLVFIITDRRNGKKLINLLNSNGYDFHDAFLGHGTAPNELSAYLGLGEPEKVVLLCFTDEGRAANLLNLLENEHFSKDDNGIAFTVKVNSASNIEVVKLIADLI